MKLKNIVLAALLGAGGIATAHAGLLTYQDVTFTSTWSGNVLTLEIDAAKRSGDWTRAKGLAALEIDGIGDYTSVSVASAPGGASSWATSSSELNAQGCSGSTNGQAGSRLCFYGQQIGLGDNMVFSFVFNGSAIDTVDPHVKVQFVNTRGKKVGSLLSQTLPASPATGGSDGTGTPVAAEPVVVPLPKDEPIAAMPPQAILPGAELPPAIPAKDAGATFPAGAESGGSASTAEVPEPQTIALLLAGFGLIGLVARRKRRG